MIPDAIKKDHIKKALEDVISGKESIPPREQSTRYDLIYRGKAYPPKAIMRIAAKHARVVLESSSTTFHGGPRTNNFLKKRGFKIQEKEAWTEQECYFAVWGYDRLDLYKQTDKDDLYRRLADVMGRSAESIKLKIRNVAHVDPRPRSEKPVPGASNAQEPIGKVFRWYWQDRDKTRDQMDELWGEAEFNIDSRPDITKPVGNRRLSTEEGAEMRGIYKVRYRSVKLIEEGRRYYSGKEHDGKLRCHVCGFTKPESVDREIVQLHHKKPIYEGKRNSKLSDMVPLCPTCHCIAHDKKPPLTVSELKKLRKGS